MLRVHLHQGGASRTDQIQERAIIIQYWQHQQMLNLTVRRVYARLLRPAALPFSSSQPDPYGLWFHNEEQLVAHTINNKMLADFVSPTASRIDSSSLSIIHALGPHSPPALSSRQGHSQTSVANQKKSAGVGAMGVNLSADGSPISQFNRALSTQQRKQNTERLCETISSILGQKSQKQFATLLVKYHASKLQVQLEEANDYQRQLLKKSYHIFLHDLQEIGPARQLLRILADCNPKLIKMEELRRKNESSKWMNYFNSNRITKGALQAAPKEELSSADEGVGKKSSKNETLDFLERLGKSEGRQRAKSKNLKLQVKKGVEVKELRMDQANLEKVEKKLFGNKKMVTEQIIFKRSSKHINEKHNNYGENWVYVYDLPYQFGEGEAHALVTVIAKRYGQIEQFIGESYENFVEVNHKESVMQLPHNYQADGVRNRVKMDRSAVATREHQIEKKPRVTKLLEKSKKQRDLALNKSTMVFKFKHKEDKQKFLNPEMRLYGLCLENLQNIRFEQAQSKNVIALSMVPWACESADLLRFINDSLSPLKITVTHPNCIIANGYVFVELANFYQALYSKDLLNNLKFQEQRIKAQLCYGSSYIYEGQYKYNFEADHYEDLLGRLAEMRNRHSKLITQ